MPNYDVVLLPSFAQVESWRKQRADAHAAGMFSQAATTFDAWIADLWELHGDGRAIVSDMQRTVLLHALFSQAGAELASAGVVDAAAACMRKAAGVPAFEAALEAARGGAAPPALAAREAAFLGMLARYEDELGQMGLVEPGCAAMGLARRAHQAFPQPVDVLVCEAAPLTHVQAAFFERCPQLNVTVEPADGADGIGPAPDGVDVRFAFPSGKLAEPGLVADVVLAHAGAGDAVVVCKDPLSLFEQVKSRLSDGGLEVRAQARKPFSQTDFGRAFLGMHRCLHDEPWNPAALSDVVLSPFSGFAKADAFKVDEGLRADRIVQREDALTLLRASSEAFSQLEELASDPDASVLIGSFEQMAQALANRAPAWRAEQLAAMGALRDASAAARRAHAGIGSCIAALERATLPVTLLLEGAGPRVVFTTQSIGARMAARSCAMLVMADLTSEDYPVADKDDAAATLLAKLGLPAEESALSRARRQFSALCKVPDSLLVVMRPLGDANADDTYPSVALEEFVDAYRPDPSATDDIDNAYRLPERLQDGLVERGEEALFANARAGAVDARQQAGAVVSQPDMADVGAHADRVLKARFNAAGQQVARPCPSPSQIELYLECPFQWFATRRLRIDTLDEGFGPLERGTFAHAVLEAFYRRFQEAGFAKVSADNLGPARELMRLVADELARAQFSEEPRSGRLVYASELERREVAALCDQLVAYLDFEARLLPTFRPAYLEYEIDADHAVDYAGYALAGKVDRIDVDDAGHAVIVDYKGSVGPEHEIAGKDAVHAGKVQTRIYAQAVKRALGLNVVGALYVSYGRRPQVTGAYDPRVLEAAHLPGMRHDRCGCAAHEEAGADAPYAELAFSAMLDATEKAAGRAIARMCAGDVAPDPSHKQACAYCPVLACPKRGA